MEDLPNALAVSFGTISALKSREPPPCVGTLLQERASGCQKNC